MARIKNLIKYAKKLLPVTTDFLIGSDSQDGDKTKSFELQSIVNLVEAEIDVTANEGYAESGTRAGGNLIVTIGDHDNSNAGTVIKVEDDVGEISMTGDLHLIETPVVYKRGLNSVSVTTDALTGDVIQTHQDKNGVIALVGDALPYQPVRSVKLILSMNGANTGSGFFSSGSPTFQYWGFTGNINFNWLNDVLTITSADSEFTNTKTIVIPSSGHITSISTSSIEVTFNNLAAGVTNCVELKVYE